MIFTFRRAVLTLLSIALLGLAVWFKLTPSPPSSDGSSPLSAPARATPEQFSLEKAIAADESPAPKPGAVTAAHHASNSPVPGPDLPIDERPFAAFRSWTEDYLKTPADHRSDLLEAGRQLARERRTALAALILQDPKAALDRAVPIVVRQALPPEIVAQLEERVSTKAFYGVLGAVPDPSVLAEVAPLRREVLLPDGQRYQAHVYGRRLRQQTTPNAHLNGIALDQQIALDERPLRVLEAGERPARGANGIFTTCPISGKSVAVKAGSDGNFPPIDDNTPAVEIAGEVHYLCSGGHIIEIEEKLLAGEGMSGGASKPTSAITTTISTGVRSLLYMRLAFPETQVSPQSESAAYDMMKTVNDFVVENSFGNLYLVTTVTPLIILPRTEAWYLNSGSNDVHLLRADAQAIARDMGYDTNQYDMDIVAYSGGPGSFGGLGFVGGKGTWLKSITAGVACHELGHNFGLWHANFWSTSGKSPIGSGSNVEYGNTFDTMGNAAAGDYHYNANHKAQINWLPTRNFAHTVTSSGTYRIFAMDQPRLDPANRYAIKIDKDNDREYWAEFRQKSFSSNKWVKDGIFINWSPWVNSNGGAQLIDTTPGSPDDRTDAALVIGRTFSDFESGIHITPIGKGGTVPESMDVIVNLGAFPTDQPPTSSIAASSTAVANSTVVTFTATATDPDGDVLSYAWDFGDKTFSTNNAPTATKSWATAGEYVVRCVVSDMKGQTSSNSLVVKVGSPTTFRISGTITLDGAPLADVRVHNGLTGSSYRGTYTNSDGSYTIAALAAGNVTVNAVLDGYSFAATFTNPVTVGPTFTTANFNATATAQVSLTVADADCTEGSANPGKFTLTRTGSTAADLVVNFLTPSGSASSSDYALSPALTVVSPYYTATIPAGQSSLDLLLTAATDSTQEGPELARLDLAPGAGYVIGGTESAAITIQDANTTLPQVSLRVSDNAGSETGDPASFLISRTGSTAAALNVLYKVTGSASNGTDYSTLSGTVTIPAGAASATLNVTPLNDALVEGTEDITVTLDTNAAYLRNLLSASYAGTVILLDDDLPSLTVTASDATASEAGGDTGTFLITRTGSTTLPLTVNYALSGTALQGIDYVPLSGVLTIPAGTDSGTVTITPIADGLGEAQQSVILQVRGGPAYVSGTPALATINIVDNTDPPVVMVAVNDGVAGEASNTGKFRFTTTGSGTGNITVHYTISGTATPGDDYTALAGTLTMGRNTTADVTLTPVNDALAEDTETVTVTIDPDPTYSSFLDASATINLTDDDQVHVDVTATVDSFSEAGGTSSFWISRSGSTTAALTVNYSLAGTATNGVDYTLLSGTIDIPAAATGVALTVTPVNDTLAEGSESVILSLEPGVYGYGVSRAATCYILDNETPTVQVRFSSASGTGAESVGTISIPVTLSAASTSAVTVNYLTSGGTALGGIDYQRIAGTLTFQPGETAKSIPLTIIDDLYQETSQTVLVKLQYANGAALGTSTYTYTVTDNDTAPVPTVAFATASSSGAESQATATLNVSLSAPQLSAVSVAYAVTGGTATSGSDYTLTAGTLTFAAGETSKVIPNTILDDSIQEGNETLIVTLSAPSGATLGTQTTHTYTILDNDTTTVTISASDASASEPGTDSGTLVLSRSGGLTSALTVNLTIAGTATNGTDYQTLPSSATIPAGSATAPLSVVPLNDSLGEGSETVLVTVTTGTGYTVGASSSATVTILDDEPTLTLTASDANAAEENLDPGVFTLTRSGNTTGSLSVTLNLSGSATVGTDYTNSPQPIVFAAGASTASLTVTPLDDLVQEGVETIIATLPAGPYLISGSASATINLADDDVNNPPVITLRSPTSTSVAIPPDVGLILDATVTDDGRPVPPGLLTTTWKMLSGPGTVTFANASAPATTATFSAPGLYVLRLTANDGAAAPTLDLTVNVTTVGNWSGQDIGAPTLAGSYTENDGTLTVKGSGTNISGTSDQFQFVSQLLTGDGEIRARVVSMSGGASSAKAGVMLRNSTTAGSRAAYMSAYGTGNSSDSFRTRATDGGSYSTSSTTGAPAFPVWVKLVRSGSNFSGYRSPDGQTWTQVGTTKAVTMDSTLLVGLAVTSNNTTALCTAVFDNITITNAPANLGPEVNAGSVINLTFPAPGNLAGAVSDDSHPAPATLSSIWSKVSGPGTVTFANPEDPLTSVTFSVPGTYVLRLTADDGEVQTFDELTVNTTPPTVTLVASAAAAAEFGPVNGQFTASRSGGTDSPLTVRFTLGGTATNGSDYQTLGTTLVIPIGSSSATLLVTPIADATLESSETVVATLATSNDYLIGTPNAGTVTIAEQPFDAWRLQKFGANAANDPLAAETANGDFDAYSNLLEYGLNGDPLVPDIGMQPVLAMEGTDLTLTYRRPLNAVDLIYGVESWTLENGWTAIAFSEEIISENGQTRLVKERVPISGLDRITLRLRISRSQPAAR